MGSDPQSYLQYQQEQASNLELEEYTLRQRKWSERVFNPGKRTIGITEHIKKEIDEIRADPNDYKEWIDIIILAIDGYWRAGGDPAKLMQNLRDKQRINFARKWPPNNSEDIPVLHDKSSE